MINVSYTNIDNSRLVGRLLPFWARGRKTSLLIQALLSPLVSLHKTFQAWALERHIECVVTSQTMVLEWYLAYRLKKHFNDENDRFTITSGITDVESCFSTGMWKDNAFWNNDLLWDNEENHSGTLQGDDEILKINVHAPAIMETNEYDLDDYRLDITSIVSRYLTCFKDIKIIIQQPST